MEIAMNRGMIEAVQRGVELRDGTADILQEICGLVGNGAERKARQPGQDADVMADPSARHELRNRRPVASGDGAWTERRPPRDVRERVILRVEELAFLAGVRNLQDESAPIIVGLEQDVLIALAG